MSGVESMDLCRCSDGNISSTGNHSEQSDSLPTTTGKNRARQLYTNISMLFLFPVKDGKLSTGVNATFDASCYG